jgi:hypothetical protein
MGFFPCSFHGAFFKGAAQAAYPALVQGTESERAHLRLCGDCFSVFLTSCEDQLTEAIEGERPPTADQRVCVMCAGSPAPAALFVTLYPSGAAPRNFFGAVCPDHMVSAKAAWGVTQTL